MCCRWEKRYGFFRCLRSDPDYKAYMTYLNFAPGIQRMVYTTNWIERLNRDFRRVLRMRTAMPSGDSVITLIGSVAMNRRATGRLLPNTTSDGKLFPRAELGRKFGEEF